jgi:hypothetical protein
VASDDEDMSVLDILYNVTEKPEGSSFVLSPVEVSTNTGSFNEEG